MFGAIAKSYYAELLGVDPHRIFCVEVMPCLAKKAEVDIPVMNDACGDPDVDVSLTVREVDRMIRAEHIDVFSLAETDFDQPLGTATGAGVIFGATGGVMEAALRSAYYLVTGENCDADAFKDVRGLDGWRRPASTLLAPPFAWLWRAGWATPTGCSTRSRPARSPTTLSRSWHAPAAALAAADCPSTTARSWQAFAATSCGVLTVWPSCVAATRTPPSRRSIATTWVRLSPSARGSVLHTNQHAWKMPREA